MLEFKHWLEELIIEGVLHRDNEGNPVVFDLHFPDGEKNPPVCRRTGHVFTGKGLICFDFDQTLTTAWFGNPKNPHDQSSHSTANPNTEMLKKMRDHKNAGNKVIIVTARGEKEGQLTGDKSHYAGLQPIVTADKTLHSPLADRKRDWHAQIKNNRTWSAITKTVESPAHAFHLGAVSLNTQGESKGPFIASKMALFNLQSRKNGENPHPETGEPQGNYLWAILYDDGPMNIKSANAQQKKGVALAGIPVAQKYDRGGERPVGVAANVGASGM